MVSGVQEPAKHCGNDIWMTANGGRVGGEGLTPNWSFTEGDSGAGLQHVVLINLDLHVQRKECRPTVTTKGRRKSKRHRKG